MILLNKEENSTHVQANSAAPTDGSGEKILRYEEIDNAGIPTGRGVSFSGVEFQPLQYNHLIGKTLDQRIAIPLSWKNAKVIESSDANMVDRIASGNAILQSAYTSRTIGLIRGGWLPSGIASHENMIILPDRCTISEIKGRFHNGEKRKGKDQDFLDLFSDKPIRINPLLFALEGNCKTNPTPEIVKQQLEEVCLKIKAALPLAELVPAGSEGLQGVIGIINDTKFNMERKQELLMRLAPMLHAPVSSNRKILLWNEILATADSCCVPKNSLVVLAALSSIMVPKGLSPAKRILKLTAKYSMQNAYNALADLRSLEVLMCLFALFPDQRLMLCTGDKNLALFWAGIRASDFIWSNGHGTFKLSPVESLLPDVTPEQIDSYFGLN